MVSFILLSISFSSVGMASASMPSSERAEEVFMGLGPEVGTMLHAKLCTSFIGVSFLECSLLIELNVAPSETCFTSSSHRVLASSLGKHKSL